MIHPTIVKAVGYAQARITGGAPVESTLLDECPECLTVTEFAVLVGADCYSHDFGLRVEADRENVMATVDFPLRLS